MTVRAAVLRDRSVAVEQFARPERVARGGWLRVAACGICGSDRAAYDGEPIYETPCVIGHETVGVIEELDDELCERWRVRTGDLVAVEEYLPCGRCRSCLAGRHQVCANSRYGGRRVDRAPGLWGGFAELMYLDPAALVHRVPAGVDPVVAQLFVPIANGLHWTQEVGGVTGDSAVVVVGPGPHGLGSVVGALEAGAEQVIVVGRPEDTGRLEAARRLGATATFRYGLDDVLGFVGELTGGAMASVVVNAAPGGLSPAIRLAGDAAVIVQAGLGGDVEAIADAVVTKALTIRGVRGRPTHMVPAALEIIASGRYDLQSLCTHVLDLDGIVAGIRLIGEGDPSHIRGVVVPNEGS